ncbi:MAG: hypothetical protein JWO20_1084 [Candidatus Angelobacter sp.]|jgi:hypothetical protein|nr:hypothetical protein [Candidatus Angelobacter sp.]
MSFIALDAYADFPGPSLYFGPVHGFVAGSVYGDLEIAALLVTLECCTPKNVWRFIYIHSLKLIMAVGTGVAG